MIYQGFVGIKNYQTMTIFCLHYSVFHPWTLIVQMWDVTFEIYLSSFFSV